MIENYCNIPGLYVMTGQSRYLWKHSLKNNTNGVRYSFTFRIAN